MRVAAVLLALTFGGVTVPVKLNRSDKTYQINPLDGPALRASLANEWSCTQEPCRGGTMEAHIETVSTMRQAGGTCTVATAEVRVITVVTTPEWTMPQGTSQARQMWWRQIHDHVVSHEGEHRRIAEDAGRDIAAKYETASAPTCDALKSALNLAKAQRVIAMEKAQSDFDKQQGVFQIPLPPP